MSALIEFDEVCKYYQMGDTTVKAADHITMKIEKGEFVAIVGQSGSGKSTCMNIIGCLDVPTYGTYRLNGRDVGKMNRNELAAVRNEMLGFIFQQYNLLPRLNLMENVEVPLVYAGISRAERHIRAREVLEQVGLGDKLKNRPNQLSGGQQQRVSIARALVRNPPVILADEPTGALDSHTGREVLGLLQQLHKQGHTVVLITHDNSIAVQADRIIRLEENYRSTKPILDVANNLLENATESFRKKLFTRKEGGAPVRLVTPLSDMSQAKLVVRRIEDLLTRHLPHEIAVLFRAGFHSYHLEMALNQAGIAFRKYGGLRYTEAAHVKDVMAYARLLLNPLDMPAFSRVAELHEGIGPKTVLKLYNVAQSADGPALDKACARFPSFREDLRFIAEMRARPLHPVTALELIVDHYRPVLESRYPEDWPRRQQGLEEILQMASGYNALDLFLADLALDSPDEEDEDNEGRITLSTVHSAKGLEWNAVLIIDLVEDRFPSRHALARPEDFEEERRLMYVACTRARQELDLYSPATIYSKAEQGTQHVAQSPFVRELPAGLTEEWVESYGGGLSKRARGGMFADPFGGRPAPSGPGAGFGRGRHAGLAAPAGLSPAQRLAATRALQDADDCQLPPDERPGGTAGGRPAAAPAASAADAAGGSVLAAAGAVAAGKRPCFCRHKIFGRGKILGLMPPNKVQVSFAGFGIKVILADYLQLED